TPCAWTCMSSRSAGLSRPCLMSSLSLAWKGSSSPKATSINSTIIAATNQVKIVAIESHHTRRRSRSSILRVNCLVSMPPVMSRSSSALPSSLSVMNVAPFQRQPQRLFGVMQPRANCPHRAVHHARHFVVAHLFEEAQDEHLAVFRAQIIQENVNARRVLGRELLVFLRPGRRHLPLIQRWHRQSALAQLAIDTVASDAVEPGTERGRLPQPRKPPEDIEPHFLEQVVCALRLAQ